MSRIISTALLALSTAGLFAQSPSQKAEASIIFLANRFGKSISPERVQDIRSMCPSCLMRWALMRAPEFGVTDQEYKDSLDAVAPTLNKGKVTRKDAEELMLVWSIFAWQLADQEVDSKSVSRAKLWVDDAAPRTILINKRVYTSRGNSSSSKVSWSTWKPK